MKVIIAFACKVLALAAMEYVILVGLGVVLWPLPDDQQTGFFQSSKAADTLFRTEPKYVVYGRKALEENRPMVVVLGSSNAAGAIHLERFRNQLPGLYIANVSVPGSNVTQIAQVHKLVTEIVPPERRQDITYVIGIWYGIFGTDASRWKGNPTDIEIELGRYGMYRKAASGWTPIISVHHLEFFNTLIRPLLGLDKVIKGGLHPVRVLFEKGQLTASGRVLSADEEANYIRFWKSYLDSQNGQLGDEQFGIFEQMVRTMRSEGSQVLLVDLAIPDWHKKMSPFQTDYVAKLTALREQLRSDGVEYLHIDGQYRDVDFVDEVHPVGPVGDQWSAQIARALMPAL